MLEGYSFALSREAIPASAEDYAPGQQGLVLLPCSRVGHVHAAIVTCLDVAPTGDGIFVIDDDIVKDTTPIIGALELAMMTGTMPLRMSDVSNDMPDDCDAIVDDIVTTAAASMDDELRALLAQDDDDIG